MPPEPVPTTAVPMKALLDGATRTEQMTNPVLDPQTPMDILQSSTDAKNMASYLNGRKYLNMPYPEFRDKFEVNEQQRLVFQDFHITYLEIEDPSGDSTLEVDVLIPKTVVAGIAAGNIPVHVRFHGGGFCTGSPTFKPWFAFHVRDLSLESNAITLMPLYRKMPESHGDDILDDVDTFWNWFQGPRFHSDLQKLFPDTVVVKDRIKKEQLLVSGDSAGGFLAAYSWISQPSLTIKAMYLQYPMLRAYTRDAGQPYRGKVIPETEVQEYAALYCDHIASLKAEGKIKPRFDSDPPEGMDMAYVLSSAKKEVFIDNKVARISYWKWWFQQPDIIDRLENIIASAAATPGVEMSNGKAPVEASEGTPQTAVDMPTFALPRVTHPRPSYCPPMFVTHGKEDTNCPYTDTLEFERLVKQLFPDAAITLNLQAQQAHAFDYAYDKWEQKRRWLLQLCMAISMAWIPGDTSETATTKECQAKFDPEGSKVADQEYLLGCGDDDKDDHDYESYGVDRSG